MATVDDFDRNVFVNCPFDEEYDPILQAVLFCLVRFGLTPRIASERSDAAEPRIVRLLELVQSSRYSIHDLSRCQAREEGEYYRLNMPFELGLDFGCRHYGEEQLKKRSFLFLRNSDFATKQRFQTLLDRISSLMTATTRKQSERYVIG